MHTEYLKIQNTEYKIQNTKYSQLFYQDAQNYKILKFFTKLCIYESETNSILCLIRYFYCTFQENMHRNLELIITHRENMYVHIQENYVQNFMQPAGRFFLMFHTLGLTWLTPSPPSPWPSACISFSPPPSLDKKSIETMRWENANDSGYRALRGGGAGFNHPAQFN